MDETWKQIPGFPDHYEVSNMGRVRTWLVRASKERAGTPTILVGCLMRGYPTVLLRDQSGKRVNVRAHQAVLESFVGPCPPGHEARHLDGTRTNNCLDNLRWGTPKENSDDKRRHGTMVLGEQSVTAKLQATDIVAIRALLRRGHGLDFVASLFGVSKRMVGHIRDGLAWDELSDREEIIKQANECPATRGCLLELVREVWCDDSIHCASWMTSEGVVWWDVETHRDSVRDRLGRARGDTEAEALVAALEAAGGAG